MHEYGSLILLRCFIYIYEVKCEGTSEIRFRAVKHFYKLASYQPLAYCSNTAKLCRHRKFNASWTHWIHTSPQCLSTRSGAVSDPFGMHLAVDVFTYGPFNVQQKPVSLDMYNSVRTCTAGLKCSRCVRAIAHIQFIYICTSIVT